MAGRLWKIQKNEPQISNPDGTWGTNGAFGQKKKKSPLFSMEKHETEEVNAYVTHLPVSKFTAAMTSEKLSDVR